jgi:hypothetical protein
VSKPTIADLPERYRLQIARQLALAKRPKTIAREPNPAPEPTGKCERAEVFLRALEVRGLPRPEREWLDSFFRKVDQDKLKRDRLGRFKTK